MMEEKSKFMSTPSFAFLTALACAIMWGSSFPLIKYGFDILGIQNDTAGKLYFASYRFFAAGLIMFFAMIVSGKTVFLSSKRDYLNLALIGLSQTTLLYIFFYIGLSNTTGVKASIITASGSFFLAIFTHFLFKNDSLTLRKIIGLLLGFTGVLLINVKDFTLTGHFKLTGEIFILIGAITSAFGNVMAKHTVTRVHPSLMCAYQFTIGSIVLFIVSLLTGNPSAFTISLKAVLLLTVLSGISAAAFSLWYLLIKHNPLSSIAMYRFLIPICGTFLSTIFISNENLNLIILISLSLVCSGIILSANTDTNNT